MTVLGRRRGKVHRSDVGGRRLRWWVLKPWLRLQLWNARTIGYDNILNG